MGFKRESANLSVSKRKMVTPMKIEKLINNGLSELEESLTRIVQDKSQLATQVKELQAQLAEKNSLILQIYQSLENAEKTNSEQTAKLNSVQHELQGLKDEHSKCSKLLIKFLDKVDPSSRQVQASVPMSQESLWKNLENFVEVLSNKILHFGNGILEASKSDFPESQGVDNQHPPRLTPEVVTETHTVSLHDNDAISQTGVKPTNQSTQKHSLKTIKKSKTGSVAKSTMRLRTKSEKSRQLTQSTSAAISREDHPPQQQILLCSYSVRGKPCKANFQTVAALNLHRINKHNAISTDIRCNLCGTLVSTMNDLYEHQDNFHLSTIMDLLGTRCVRGTQRDSQSQASHQAENKST